MNEWLRTLRSIPFRFIHLEGDDAIHYHEMQSRENARALADALQLNVVGLPQERFVNAFIRRKPQLLEEQAATRKEEIAEEKVVEGIADELET